MRAADMIRTLASAVAETRLFHDGMDAAGAAAPICAATSQMAIMLAMSEA